MSKDILEINKFFEFFFVHFYLKNISTQLIPSNNLVAFMWAFSKIKREIKLTLQNSRFNGFGSKDLRCVKHILLYDIWRYESLNWLSIANIEDGIHFPFENAYMEYTKLFVHTKKEAMPTTCVGVNVGHSTFIIAASSCENPK